LPAILSAWLGSSVRPASWPRLSHSNIAAIHGLEEAEGERFLVLEYVPDTSLAERLTRGSLPVEDALKVAFTLFYAAGADLMEVQIPTKPALSISNPQSVHDVRRLRAEGGMAPAPRRAVRVRSALRGRE